jgi:undecaprenyl pyrophosphate phosphatase UppP
MRYGASNVPACGGSGIMAYCHPIVRWRLSIRAEMVSKLAMTVVGSTINIIVFGNCFRRWRRHELVRPVVAMSVVLGEMTVVVSDRRRDNYSS